MLALRGGRIAHVQYIVSSEGGGAGLLMYNTLMACRLVNCVHGTTLLLLYTMLLLVDMTTYLL